MEPESLGQILLQDTNLEAEQLDLALRIQQTRRPRPDLGSILIEKEFITAAQLCQGLARQWGIPFLETISKDRLETKLINKIPLEFLKNNLMLPIIDQDDQVAIATDDPLNVEPLDCVMNLIGRYCQRVIVPADEIEKAISQCFYNEAHPATEAYPGLQSANNRSKTKAKGNPGAQSQKEDLLNVDELPPVIKLVNTILFQAINHRASDIHIEPYEEEAKVRFRIDGVLHDTTLLPINFVPALISRLKIMANLNIAERRLPQDGQCQIKIGDNELDVRVSVIPASGGERIVLRLLDKGGPDLNISNLGLEPTVQDQFINLTNSPHGIVLLTGPTGSGKTTTLYCALSELNTHERNILTVEDPIEYQLTGVGQMQVKPKIDLTFANCLRHILRQDPDVIMIGEIRDSETAEIAIHASLTGHLVLSTLHTNDSASAATRLIDMGIEPYLISSSLTGVMAQRLLRKVCPDCKTVCKTEYNIHDTTIPHTTSLPVNPKFYVGTGCARCSQTGYFGRIAIAELLAIDDKIKELIVKRTTAHQIMQTACQNGMLTLRDDGIRQALLGVTSVEEVLRVTQDNASPGIGVSEHVNL